MKKIILIFLFLMLSGCSFQNELFFKVFNIQGNKDLQEKNYSTAQENYENAENFMTGWKIIARNNVSAVLYEENKYKEAQKIFSEMTDSICDVEKNKTILSFCENIFYGLGNTLYRLGEQNENQDKQSKFWEKAISAYKKSLQINSKNLWAKENIEFIQNKLTEKEKQNEKNSANQENQKEGKNEDSDQKQASSKQSESSHTLSRLPEEMQKNLEDYQKQLEQIEAQNQQAFKRNANAQQQNQSNNPFENDPFFQQFFDNQQKNFNKNLLNQDEKDW